MDITYGDTVAPGGTTFALAIVDRKTRYNYVFIIATLQQLKVSARKLHRTLYTDFDPKLLSHKVC